MVARGSSCSTIAAPCSRSRSASSADASKTESVTAELTLCLAPALCQQLLHHAALSLAALLDERLQAAQRLRRRLQPDFAFVERDDQLIAGPQAQLLPVARRQNDPSGLVDSGNFSVQCHKEQYIPFIPQLPISMFFRRASAPLPCRAAWA